MSYIATDFDNLNAGINILNITETEQSLIPFEGTFTDKGLGYKQQYLALDTSGSAEVCHPFLDFCFIFKDGFDTTNVTYLNFNSGSITDVSTPTITADSSGNVVWLFKNVDSWLLNNFLNDYGVFYWNKNNEEYSFVIHSKEPIQEHSTDIRVKQPDELTIVRYVVEETNITFEANRSSPTSRDIEILFNGTFYNGSLGLVNNEIDQIEIYHFDSQDNKVVDKVLVEGTDYTINSNEVHSGNSSNPSRIIISTSILYNQKGSIFIRLKTTFNSSVRNYFIPKGIPIFNWADGKFFVNGDLLVRDTDGNNEVNILDKINKLGKQLWSGNFSSGSINVPGLNDYYIIAVELSNGVICVGKKFYGVGGYVGYAEYNIYTCGYRFNASGETLTIDNENKGGSDGNTNLAIINIYGIF